MSELLDAIGHGGAWSIFLVIFFIIWGAPAVLSRHGAEKLWLVGKVARWVTSRQERSVERERRLKAETTSSLRADIQALRGDLDEEKARSELREDRLQATIDTQMGYIEWETSWARDVILMAAEHGWRPPLPKWFSFTEWRNRARPEVQHPDRER